MPLIIDSDIEICESIAGEAFTAPELEIVNTYVASVAGVWDSFDQLDADSIREFGQRLVDELKGHLVTWGDRIAELHHRLTVCGGGNLTQPAARFIDLEAGRWRGSHNALTGAVLDFMGVGLLADPLAGTEEADQAQPSNVVPLTLDQPTTIEPGHTGAHTTTRVCATTRTADATPTRLDVPAATAGPATSGNSSR